MPADKLVKLSRQRLKGGISNVGAWRNVDGVLRRHALPRWAKMPVQDLRRSHIHELIDELVQSGRNGVAREVRKHLSRFFNWAVDREIIGDNPIHGFKRSDLQNNDEAGPALEDNEIRWVWQATEALGYPFGALYRLLLFTGQRRTEWAASRRSEINSDKQWLEVPKDRYKGDRDHIVPLGENAWSLFQQLPIWPGNDYFLFSTRGGKVPISGFSKGKTRLDQEMSRSIAAEQPGTTLTPFRVHDLRVTCETRLARLGFNQDVRDAVIGHAKAGLQKTYNKYNYLSEKREAINAYEAHIMNLVK